MSQNNFAREILATNFVLSAIREDEGRRIPSYLTFAAVESEKTPGAFNFYAIGCVMNPESGATAFHFMHMTHSYHAESESECTQGINPLSNPATLDASATVPSETTSRDVAIGWLEAVHEGFTRLEQVDPGIRLQSPSGSVLYRDFGREGRSPVRMIQASPVHGHSSVMKIEFV